MTQSGLLTTLPLRIALGVLLASAARASETDDPVSRGSYLVNAAAACAGCHTPTSPSGRGAFLSGGRRFGRGASPVAANITQDRETGIGAWSDSQIADALRRGVRPDGSPIGPPMPQVAYRSMTNRDLDAIVAYLRTVPPVSNPVPAPHAPAASSGRPESTVAPIGRSPGAYLANAVSHCTECHTPGPGAAPNYAGHLDEGGRLFQTADGPVVAPPITPASLESFSDQELSDLITAGRRPDGSKLKGPMPVGSYAKLTPGDLRDLILYLRNPSAP